MVLWRTNLDIHICNLPEFRGFDKLLKLVRKGEKEPTDLKVVYQLALDVDDKETENKTGKQCFTSAFSIEVETRSEELYKLIHPRLNASMAMHAMRVRNMNGFELYRLTSQKLDLVNNLLHWALKDDLRAFGYERAKNLGEVKNIVFRLEHFRLDYEDKLCSEIPDDELRFIIWRVMDDQTNRDAIAAGHDPIETKYATVVDLILGNVKLAEDREILMSRRRKLDKGGDVEMPQMYALATDTSSGEEAPQTPDEDLQCYGEDDWWSYMLNAFKGKGKKGGTKGLAEGIKRV